MHVSALMYVCVNSLMHFVKTEHNDHTQLSVTIPRSTIPGQFKSDYLARKSESAGAVTPYLDSISATATLSASKQQTVCIWGVRQAGWERFTNIFGPGYFDSKFFY